MDSMLLPMHFRSLVLSFLPTCVCYFLDKMVTRHHDRFDEFFKAHNASFYCSSTIREDATHGCEPA